MSLNEMIVFHKDLFIEFRKLGVSVERNDETFLNALHHDYPLLTDKYDRHDFNIQVIKYPLTPEKLEYTYDCEIKLNPRLKQLFRDLYPEALI